MRTPELMGSSCHFRYDLTDKVLTAPDLGNLKVIVASYPRSGTTWLYNTLGRLGIRAAHEHPFSPAHVSLTHETEFRPLDFVVTVDVTGFAVEYLRDLRARGARIIHLLRHPVDTINSCLNYFPCYFLPKHKAEYWDWVCKCWLAFREQNDRYRTDPDIYLEDPIDAVRRVGTILGCTWTDNEIVNASNHSYRGKSTKGTVGGWEQLPENIRSYAESKGYEPKGFLGRPGRASNGTQFAKGEEEGPEEPRP